MHEWENPKGKLMSKLLTYNSTSTYCTSYTLSLLYAEGSTSCISHTASTMSYVPICITSEIERIGSIKNFEEERKGKKKQNMKSELKSFTDCCSFLLFWSERETLLFSIQQLCLLLSAELSIKLNTAFFLVCLSVNLEAFQNRDVYQTFFLNQTLTHTQTCVGIG